MIFKLKNLRNPSFKNIDCTWKKFIGQADKCTWYKFIGQAFLFKKAFQIYRGSWNMSQFLKNWSKTVLCLLIPLRVNSPWLLELLLLRESVHTLIFWWITFFVITIGVYLTGRLVPDVTICHISKYCSRFLSLPKSWKIWMIRPRPVKKCFGNERKSHIHVYFI